SRRMPMTVMAAAQSCNVILPAPRDFHSIPLLYYGKSAAPMEIRCVGWVERRRNPSVGKWKNDGFRRRSTHPTAGGYVTDQTCEILNNLTYATHDGVELKGDLYLPSGPGPFPIIVNVHGGYWRRGSRDTFQYWGPYLAARGYAGFTVSYRLTKPGQKTYPGEVREVRPAVQSVRRR